MRRSLVFALVSIIGVSSGAGCSLFTVKADPMPPLEINANRPPPGPDRVVLTDSKIVIKDKVQFATGKAEILSPSFGLLDEVAAVFVDNPQIEQVQVEGHTDSTGGAGVNRKLSQARAESVVKYLTGKGVKKNRMIAKGFGPDVPIADNNDEAGREQNRRVEFNIVKQGPKKTIIKDE